MVKRLTAFVLLFIVLVSLAGCPAPARRPLRAEPSIRLLDARTGQIRHIKIEEYVQGVVAAEMDTSWPTEALAAQAILARTFTRKKVEEGGVRNGQADISTDKDESQAYDPAKINDNVRQAVAKTRGKVVTYKGRYINAWFHADAGGRTAASAVEGLNYRKEKAPYVQSVSDPGFAQSPPENKAWQASFPWDRVRQAARQAGGTDPGDDMTAAVVEKGPSGRAVTVKVGAATLSAPALRLALGSEEMRSTLLSQFTVGNGNLVVAGKGYGHGVGMSQWGAKALAEQDKSAEDIIRYFFRDVEIRQEWR
ncbi:MAG: SpoIID/LytB domain-containing protein [Clostridia bacterium]|nr:MAG: SpoIID/LytB domain-containing protein [Clostridia bacterium]